MEATVKDAIKQLAEKCKKDDAKSEDTMRFSQSALNLAHVLATFDCNSKENIVENCNHELVRVQECTKCGKTFNTIPPSADWEVLEKLEADTLRFMVVDLQNGIERMDVAQRTEREEWRSLEKQYAESLGRLAQLCDTVCPYIFATCNPHDDTTIYQCADEIMEYVNSVRP